MKSCSRCGARLDWPELPDAPEPPSYYSIECRYYRPGSRTMFVELDVCAGCWSKLSGSLDRWYGDRFAWKT